jgi:hypothetical protein
MISISLNQTESEKRLHRILYYVKVLRLLILNFVLMCLAVVLYVAFGITGLYPAATYQINALRSHINDPERYLYILTFVIIFLLGTAFSVWLYISIIRVWRKSLKAQVIFYVICCPVFVRPCAAVSF